MLTGLLTVGSWSLIIPESNEDSLVESSLDETVNEPDVQDKEPVSIPQSTLNDNDQFEVYEIIHPRDDEAYTDEYFDYVNKLHEKNLVKGWGNAGPAWYETPTHDGFKLNNPIALTRAALPSQDKLLVIFINFTDSVSDSNHDPVNRGPQYFNDSVIFNMSKGANSMHNYFKEVSYDKYNVTGECVWNSSSTTGWYTANTTEAYFGMREMYNPPKVGYGNARELVYQAVKLAEPDVNFSEYDVDNNGWVDHLMVVHAGLDDAADGDSTGWDWDPQIWSHRGGTFIITDEGPFIGGYTMLAEKSAMGVFAHEYGHDIGLYDWYNTSKGPDIVKKWELMSGGSYNTYGGKDTPAHMSTWNKEFLGWHTPIVVNETNNNQGIKTVRATSEPINDSTSFKVNLPGTNEWYYVENRWKNTSSFDAGLPDSGIMIWHIDLDKPGNFVTPGKWIPENANSNDWNLSFDGLPATNPNLNDAAWSLEDNQILFNATTWPRTTTNDNITTLIQMDMINNSGPLQRIRILLSGDPSGPGIPTITSILDVPGDNGHTVNITWSKSSDDGSGDNDVKYYNIYINDTGQGLDGTKHLVDIIPANGSSTYSYILGGLVDGTIYHFSIRADDGPNESPWAINVSGICFDNIANPPTGLVVADTVNDDGGNITLIWSLSADDSLDIVGYNVSMNDTGIIATLGPGTTTYKVGNLTNGVSYTFNVSAFDEVYNIGYSLNETAQPIDDFVGIPTGLASNPVSWTSTNSFTISWTNPFDNSGIIGAYYKLDSLPLSPTDGIYIASADINQISSILVVGSGVHPIYVWLVDGQNNKNHTLYATTNLYYDALAPDAPQNVAAVPSNWTKVNSFDISWTNPSDLTAVSGVYYKLDSAPASNTDGILTTAPDISSLSSISVTGDSNVHPIYIWLVDGLTNINYLNSSFVTLYYDKTAPAAPSSLQADPSIWTNRNDFNLSWSNPTDLSGIVGAYYKLDDPPVFSTDGTLVIKDDLTYISNVTVGSDGSHTIYVWLVDNATNVDHLNTASVEVYFDSTAPSKPETPKASPSSWTSSDLFSFNWTNPIETSYVTGVYYKISSVPTSNNDGIYVSGFDINSLTDITVGIEGAVPVYFWLNDSAGNVDYKNYNSAIAYRDVTAPGLPGQFVVTPPAWTSVNNFSIQWQNPTELSGIKGAYYKLDSAPTSNTDGTLVLGNDLRKISNLAVLGNGGHTIYVWLIDLADNVDFNNYNTTVLRFDDQPPGAPKSLVVNPSTWSSNNAFTFTWENPVDFAGINGAYYKIGSPPERSDDGTLVPGLDITTLKDLRVESEGIWDVYVWLIDTAGNFNYTMNSTIKIYYDKKPPTIIHTKITKATSWVAVNILATIEDPHSNVRAAYIFYKRDTDPDYSSIKMTHKGNSYEGQIPKHKLDLNSISYFLMALDNSEPDNRVYFGRYGETYLNITAATDIDISITDEDRAPPTISHTVVQKGTYNQPITLSATVHDDASGISEVVLYYKSVEDSTYKTKNMIKSYSFYTATIEGESVTLGGLSYYIKAVDSSPLLNTAYFGYLGQVHDEPTPDTDIDIIVTATDTTPPLITFGPIVKTLTETQAEIFWVTDEPADSLVDFGLSSIYTNLRFNTALTTEHSVNLTGLSAGTLYHFMVSSTDSLGNGPTSSKDATFITQEPGLIDTDGDGITDDKDNDDDNDGMPDDWENEHNLDPKDFLDADEDNDNDGFTNRAEYFGSSDPNDDMSTPVGNMDKTPPTISHDSIPRSKTGKAITITADVTDTGVGVKEVILFYKLSGEDEYRQINMGFKNPRTAIIPANETENVDLIEYYIYAVDFGNNKAYYGKNKQVTAVPGPDTDIDIDIKSEFDDPVDETIWEKVGEPFGITDPGTCVMLLIILIAVIVAIGFGVYKASQSRDKKLEEKAAEERYARRQREISESARRTGAYERPRPRPRSQYHDPRAASRGVQAAYQRDYSSPPPTPPAPVSTTDTTAEAQADATVTFDFKQPEVYADDEEDVSELELEEGEVEDEQVDDAAAGPEESEAEDDDEEIYKLSDDEEQSLEELESKKRWNIDDAGDSDYSDDELTDSDEDIDSTGKEDEVVIEDDDDTLDDDDIDDDDEDDDMGEDDFDVDDDEDVDEFFDGTDDE